MFERSEKCTHSFLLQVHVSIIIIGVISGRHASPDCVRPTTLVAGLCTTYRGERVLVVIKFNVTFLPLRPYRKNVYLFLERCKKSNNGCALWCSQIVYTSISPYYLNTTTVFYFVTECPDVSVSLRMCAGHKPFVLHQDLGWTLFLKCDFHVQLWM